MQIQSTAFGYRVSLQATLQLILTIITDLHQSSAGSNTLKLKLTLDGRPMAGKSQVLLGIVPLNTNLLVQSRTSTFPLLLIEADESKEILQ